MQAGMSFSRSVAVWRQGRALVNRGKLAAPQQWMCPLPSSIAMVTTSARHPSKTEEDKAHQHPSQSTDSSQQGAILHASLQFVPQFGWTPAALVEGARSLELPPTTHEMFSRGGGELVDHFEQECNQQLVGFMEGEKELRGTKLIQPAIEHRLRMIIPYMDKWPQAMSLKAFPSNVPSALENLALMVDDVWHCAGDRSSDFSWYTKRALLATLYSSTELYMVRDGSVDYQDTWDFLNRRLEDTVAFAKASNQLESSLSGAVELMSAGITTARNMLGLNSWNR